MANHKKSLFRVRILKKRFEEFPVIRAEPAAVAAVVEASTCNNDREPILRQLRKLIPEYFLSVQFLRYLPENSAVLRCLFQKCAVITFRISGLELPLKLFGFLFKNLPAAHKNLIFALTHAAELFKPHAEQFFKAQFLIDGVCAVQGAAVRTLYAANPGIKILPQGMVLQTAEIVEPYIGADLKLQRDPVVTELLKQARPFGASQVAGVQAMADTQCWEFLSFVQRVLNTANGIGHIVTQTVVLAGVNTDDETAVFIRNSDKFPDHTAQLKNIVDLLADDIRASHIGVARRDAETA